MAPQYTVKSNSKTFIWKQDSRAGDIPAYVYYGAQDNVSHPIAILYHAGGFVMGSTHMIPKNQVDYLVSKGFVVVLPEYRLAPQVSLAEGPVQDAKDSFFWAKKKLPALLKESVGIEADGKRTACIGYSAGAFLALTTGTMLHPPSVIVDFYGVKYLEDKAYDQPLAAFSQMPTLPDDFLNKIYDGPVPVTSIPMFVNGKPALHDPRAAWFIAQLKNGTSISSLVPDGNYDFEVSKKFSSKFPPTFFVHGTNDPFIPCKVSVQANEELKKGGTESVLLTGDDIVHVFDLELDEKDPKFIKYVVPALDFAVSHV